MVFMFVPLFPCFLSPTDACSCSILVRNILFSERNCCLLAPNNQVVDWSHFQLLMLVAYSAWTSFVSPFPSKWELTNACVWSVIVTGSSTPQASIDFLTAWILVALHIMQSWTWYSRGPWPRQTYHPSWYHLDCLDVMGRDLMASFCAPGCKADAFSGMSQLVTT